MSVGISKQSNDITRYRMISDRDIDTDTDIDRDIDKDIDIDRDVATATLKGNPSSSFEPTTTADIRPVLMIEGLDEDIFKGAEIDKGIVIDVLLHFCTRYKEIIGKSCPPITEEFARAIPSLIASLIDRNTGEILLDSDKWKRNPVGYTQWYTDMIDKYFDTKFSEGCDYSLPHFFSGDIRALRFHEIGRMPYDI